MATASLKQTEIRHDKAKANKYTYTHVLCICVHRCQRAHTLAHRVVHNCLPTVSRCPLHKPLCKIRKKRSSSSSNTKTSQNNSRQLRQPPLLCSAPSLPPSLLPSYPRRAIAVSNSSCVAVSLVANHFQKLLFTVVDFLQRLQKMQHKKKTTTTTATIPRERGIFFN